MNRRGKLGWLAVAVAIAAHLARLFVQDAPAWIEPGLLLIGWAGLIGGTALIVAGRTRQDSQPE